MRIGTAVALATALVIGLSASTCDLPDPVPEATSLERVSGDAQQAEVGAALPDPLVVRVLDQDGNPMAGVQVDWSTDDGTVAAGSASDADGLTSATWTLGTEAGSQSAAAALDASTSVAFTATAVAGALSSITLDPDSLGFDAFGDTATIEAAGTDGHGNPVGFTATWVSRDTAAAAVDAAGKVTAKGNGSTWAVVSSNGVSDSARVVVQQAAASVEVSPAQDTVLVGGTAGFTAAARDANAHALAGAAFTWGTMDTLIATVDSLGVVTGHAEGTTKVFATHGSLSDSAQVTVEVASGLDEALIGEWVERSLVYRNQNDTTQVVDELAMGRYMATISFRADGTVQYREEHLLQGSSSESGTWMVTGDTLVLDMATEDTTYRFIYAAGTAEFTYEVEEDAGWDFDGDGVDEPTFTTSTWERQVDLPELVGTWTMAAGTLTNAEDTTQMLDLVEEGLGFTLVLHADGTHETVFTLPDEVIVDQGRYVTTATSLWIAEPDAVLRFDLEITSTGFTAVSDDWEDHDFDGDGTLEPTIITFVMEPDDGAPDGTIDPDLVGDWLGLSYVLENQNDASQEVDLVVDEMLLVEVSLYEDGSFRTSDTEPDGHVSWQDAGTWYTRNDTIVWYSYAEQDSILIPYVMVDADHFGFETENQEGYDFDGDGVDEPTNEFGLLGRRIDAQLVGTWVAEEQVIANAADTTQWVDAVAEGGSLTVTFYSDGSIVVEQVEPDLGDEWDLDGESYTFTAEYAAAEPFLWIIYGPHDRLYLFLEGNDVAVVVSEYTLDGTGEDVVETIRLRRQ